MDFDIMPEEKKEYPQLWYKKKQIDCVILEHEIKEDSIYIKVAPFNNTFHKLFEMKYNDYKDNHLAFFGVNEFDIYSPLYISHFRDNILYGHTTDIELTLTKMLVP